MLMLWLQKCSWAGSSEQTCYPPHPPQNSLFRPQCQTAAATAIAGLDLFL